MLAALLIIAPACNLNSFLLSGDVDGDGGLIDATGSGGDGGDGDGGGTIDAGPDASTCLPTPEVCDGLDNDCDGVADNGFDLDNDPNNCGSCGFKCQRLNSAGTCGSVTAGVCEFECLPGAFDLDGDDEPEDVIGCEYECVKTATVDDSCNERDDDCDGDPDDDVDFTDPTHCGSCGNYCQSLNATASCTDTGGGVYGCTLGDCDENFYNADGDDEPTDIKGCEYYCTGTPGADEECNGVDDDCDGDIDEFVIIDNEAPVGQDTCYTFGGAYEGVGACTVGLMQCFFGVPLCVGDVAPEPNGVDFDCDEVDEDCDGTADEDRDFTSDATNCGGCTTLPSGPGPGVDCTDGTYEHATAECFNSACRVQSCDLGWTNLDQDDEPLTDDLGCEYNCTFTGPEVCDGLDNDCDGDTDTDDGSLVTVGNNFCRSVGDCAKDSSGANMAPVCGETTCTGSTTTRWYCPYDTTGTDPDNVNHRKVELNGCEPVASEVKCDGFDGDCDGADDDTYSSLGTQCDNGEFGTCKITGEWECDATDLTQESVVCSVEGQTGTPGTETCDGTDEDCDQEVDEGAPDTWVAITNTLAGTACSGTCTGTCNVGTAEACTNCTGDCTFWMYKYEASRPDADDTTAGGAGHRSCSKAGDLPWALVTFDEAVIACEEAGKLAGRVGTTDGSPYRLCSESEWMLACGGTGTGTGACTLDTDCDPDAEFCNTDIGQCVNKYPYAGSYDPYACNGYDWDESFPTCDGSGIEIASVTGATNPCDTASDNCESDDGVVDLSGNLKEWVDELITDNPGSAPDSYRVRGGSYNNIEEGLTCDLSFAAFKQNKAFQNLGFRCCSSIDPNP